MRAVAAGLASAILLSLVGTAQTYPPPFPREDVTKLMENDRVAVWDTIWPKGRPTAMHQHPYDIVGTFLQTGTRLITAPDGTKRTSDTKIYDVAYSAKGLIHIEEGTSDTPTRAIILELKEAGPSTARETASDVPPAFPRPGARQVLDNPRVTVWDYKWTRGQTVPLHRHVRDAVVVWFENGKLRSIPQAGDPSVVEATFGTIRYSPRGTIHAEEAVEGPPHAVIIELK